jgi:hypothetical protein
MHLLFAVGAGSGSPACFSHPNSGSCSSNSPGAQVFAILIVAAIVVLAILALLYKRTSSTVRPRGPLSARSMRSSRLCRARAGDPSP